MKMKILSVGIIVLLLGTLAVPAEAAAASDSDFRVTKMIVEPAGPDLNITVYYESGFFTRVFSILFGAKVLQPDILKVFTNFSNVSLVSIDSNSGVAKVAVNNVSKLNRDGWYVYDGNTTFTSKAAVIEIHNKDGTVVSLSDTNKLPVISSKMPVLSKK